MNRAKLTDRAKLATFCVMQEMFVRRGMRRLAVPVAASLALGGCITIDAPEKPIVIELNVNIRQEVIYRLAEDAGETIEENQDIF